jgi:hypothetical protein
MKRLQIPLASMIACILLLSAEPADAQRPRNIPRSPTLSPYFDLYRLDPGPLGPYHSDFRPRQEFRRAVQQQSARLQRQNTNIRSLDRRMSLVERPPATVRPTGTGSVFMNYSHYYNLRGLSGSSGGRRSWSPQPAQSRGYAGYGSYGNF